MRKMSHFKTFSQQQSQENDKIQGNEKNTVNGAGKTCHERKWKMDRLYYFQRLQYILSLRKKYI